MVDLISTGAIYDSDGFYRWELDRRDLPLDQTVLDFDKHGYRLTDLETEYAFINGRPDANRRYRSHRELRQEWIRQDAHGDAASINHAFIWERKGYDGSARSQLERWRAINPIFGRLLAIKPRWGFSFSMDWIDRDGDPFEILSYDFVGIEFKETQDMMMQCLDSFVGMDWDSVALRLHRKMDQWIGLDQSAQTNWKCDYLGIKRPGIKRCVWI